MLLVEQIIGTIAEELAKQIEQRNYSERNLWVPAARQLRFPYWDWAAEDVARNGLPRVLKEDKLKVFMGGRNEIEVANPLSYYPYVGEIPPDFQDVESVNGVSYFSQWRRSFRYAESSPDAKRSNIQALERVLKRNVPDMRRKIALLFTFPNGEDSAKAWDEFSNTAMESKRENDQTLRGSLEGVHNNVHSYLGGNGHMSDPDYAAFDPIFFLHHSNVDRLFSLWEWCYPKYWMQDGYTYDGTAYPWTQDRGTYHQVYNEQVLPRGNLAPFRTEKGEYWTSEQTRFLDPKIPGFHPKYYSYPEFEGIKVDLPANDAMRNAGRNKIAKHYGFNPRDSAHRGRGTHPSFPIPRNIPVGIPDNYEMIPQYRSFVVQVRLLEHAYNRSYSFNLTYKTPSGSEEYVGSVSVFARADHSPCAECASRRASRSVVRGVIPIPDTLVEKIISLILAAGSFEAILGNIKKGLTGELVDSTGQKLATAEGGDDAEDVPAGRSTSAKVTPLTISLLSSAIAEDADDSVYMLDSSNHGDIFSHGWLATHEDSRLE
ncbi:hypothetical protein SERLA73DRAFT_178343 [Serpula lacrymans var. lacrymans S7.3]|uniref:tyrosinase n=1 Tax=Serpula lacrymans var. lacrymans (strain S7.3) TaxID=936435 RepID=F8PRB7_SERL3|nr:hypothetical protein SERLA73DRAFT_178343 [Serpula lacrymans var. lacrymans S7.3]